VLDVPRDGTKNLIPQNKRTKEEQKEIARKGGQASGVTRRKQKTYKEMASLLAKMEPLDSGIKEKAKQLGLKDSDITNGMLCTFSLMIKAQKGDVKAMELWLALQGQKPVEQVEIKEVTTDWFIE